MKLLLFLLSLSVGFHLCSCDSHEITNGLTAPRRPSPPRLPPPPCPPPHLPPPPPLPSRPQPGYDYFILALTWPNAYCQETGVTCNPSPLKQYFSIYGLWPNKNNGLPLDLRNTKNNYSNSGHAYLAQTTLKGARTYGIKPDGKAYDWVKITDAIKKATGNKDGYLTCENDTSGQLQLSEIRICFEADAVNLKNCGRKPPVKCRNDLVFASPPPSPAPPPPKSLDTSM
ncbi:hypothetical protein L6164_028646 [Bauhinia variegata]|uniref:Uncharacterized protein n=1 Tax=Bauhinia variegata TaxID=167791 RepID=A0ACB9L749_BAUVA|nr:hypothetical protein L6164_028646 [Bauhinia variegata]